MQTKNLTVTEMDDAGKGLALIAELNAVDHDGDTYAPGAFNWKEQWAPLLTAHDRHGMPFGKARVYEQGDKAYAELHLNLETQAGRDWHAALKFDLATGKSVQEWSYGYKALDFEYRADARNRIRVLKQLDVHEVSTVVRGAGRGTGTVMMKGLKGALKDQAFADLFADLGNMVTALQGDPNLLSATGMRQLKEIHASLGLAIERVGTDPAKAEAEAKALLENEMAWHLTRDARQKFGPR
ncbi:MAG: HK97 family phage prohead protease [Erythrobacter sp.]